MREYVPAIHTMHATRRLIHTPTYMAWPEMDAEGVTW
jgi:hypothetical protein